MYKSVLRFDSFNAHRSKPRDSKMRSRRMLAAAAALTNSSPNDKAISKPLVQYPSQHPQPFALSISPSLAALPAPSDTLKAGEAPSASLGTLPPSADSETNRAGCPPASLASRTDHKSESSFSLAAAQDASCSMAATIGSPMWPTADAGMVADLRIEDHHGSQCPVRSAPHIRDESL